jgi:hypothetical protein
MNFFKKIGAAVIFYALGYIINANMNYLFAPGGMSYIGYLFPSVIVISVILVASARFLRADKLKKNHKGDESDEKKIFNGDLKGKCLFIVKTKEFKLEFIIGSVISLIAIFSPIMQFGFTYGFPAMIWSGSDIALLVISILVLPFYISALNLLAWVMAYNKTYKRKAY